MSTTSPGLIFAERIACTAESWLSKTRAGPENFRMLSSTPAVSTIQPWTARLPFSTASPPSLEKGCSALRITPASRSRSSESQRRSWLKATWLGTPPGHEEIAHCLALGLHDVPALDGLAD